MARQTILVAHRVGHMSGYRTYPALASLYLTFIAIRSPEPVRRMKWLTLPVSSFTSPRLVHRGVGEWHFLLHSRLSPNAALKNVPCFPASTRAPERSKWKARRRVGVSWEFSRNQVAAFYGDLSGERANRTTESKFPIMDLSDLATSLGKSSFTIAAALPTTRPESR